MKTIHDSLCSEGIHSPSVPASAACLTGSGRLQCTLAAVLTIIPCYWHLQNVSYCNCALSLSTPPCPLCRDSDLIHSAKPRLLFMTSSYFQNLPGKLLHINKFDLEPLWAAFPVCFCWGNTAQKILPWPLWSLLNHFLIFFSATADQHL